MGGQKSVFFLIRVSLQDQNSVPNSDYDMFYGLNGWHLMASTEVRNNKSEFCSE